MAKLLSWKKPLRLRIFLFVWRLSWLLLMPAALGYLYWRGRRDPLYRQRIWQRFGFARRRATDHVWVHAVSIGELRSAVPLIRALLDRGENVVTTHFTPAGLREAERVFAEERAEGRIASQWVPFDYGLAFRRFFRAFRPRYGLVMEVEFWPGMITAARRAGVPLYLCNGQYPGRSYERDKARFLSPALLVPGFNGAMVKSDLQVERFSSLGVRNIAITGEMRFEQPVPQVQLGAATRARPLIAAGRRVIALASVVEWEEDIFIRAIQDVLKTVSDPPFFVFIPRAPERFDVVTAKIADAGLDAVRRSSVLDRDLRLESPGRADLLIGDSLGEMYFYLALSDLAVVGGGFNPRGSHNIIEPLALRKPVILGPEIWTIEYPAMEAIEAGVARQVKAEELVGALSHPVIPPREKIESFLAAHSGAVDKTLKALDEWQD